VLIRSEPARVDKVSDVLNKHVVYFTGPFIAGSQINGQFKNSTVAPTAETISRRKTLPERRVAPTLRLFILVQVSEPKTESRKNRSNPATAKTMQQDLGSGN